MPQYKSLKLVLVGPGMDWTKLDFNNLPNYPLMAGGEPTAMDSTYWLLEHLIEIGRAKHVDIGIVSNSSLWYTKRKNIRFTSSFCLGKLEYKCRCNGQST